MVFVWWEGGSAVSSPPGWRRRGALLHHLLQQTRPAQFVFDFKEENTVFKSKLDSLSVRAVGEPDTCR